MTPKRGEDAAKLADEIGVALQRISNLQGIHGVEADDGSETYAELENIWGMLSKTREKVAALEASASSPSNDMAELKKAVEVQLSAVPIHSKGALGARFKGERIAYETVLNLLTRLEKRGSVA